MFFFLIIRRPPRSTLFPYTTLFRSPARPVGSDDGRDVVPDERLVIIAQRPRAGGGRGTADHRAAEPPHHHRTELPIHRRTDEPARRESARALLDQELAAIQLVLVPVARHQGGRPRQRLVQVSHPFHTRHAAGEPPGADDGQSQRHRQPVQPAPCRRHPPPRACRGAVKRVAQSAVIAAHRANSSSSDSARTVSSGIAKLVITQAAAPGNTPSACAYHSSPRQRACPGLRHTSRHAPIPAPQALSAASRATESAMRSPLPISTSKPTRPALTAAQPAQGPACAMLKSGPRSRRSLLSAARAAPACAAPACASPGFAPCANTISPGATARPVSALRARSASAMPARLARAPGLSAPVARRLAYGRRAASARAASRGHSPRRSV